MRRNYRRIATKIVLLLAWASIPLLSSYAQSASQPALRLAIARITHGHAGWIFGSKNTENVKVVAIYEPDQVLVRKYMKEYKLPEDLFYDDLQNMLDAVKPEAVAAFGSIYEHLAVVEACAPRRIHVMVEKPLAVSNEHASRMEELAEKYGIHLLTNYETSWYPSTAKAYQLAIDSNYVGAIRKVVIHDGHSGPKEIGVSKEFLAWLTDPVQNGGGALMDFGCYGANLMTYLMKGQEPLSVTAVTRQFKPAVYPKVDDDATIIVNYPGAQCIIQASWNWPFNRKDMEVYGETGYIITVDDQAMRLRNRSGPEKVIRVTSNDIAVYENPFSYLADAIAGTIEVPENGLYSLKTNIMVVRILTAAKESAKTGKTIYFSKNSREE